LQSLSRLSTLPKRNTNLSTSGLARPALMPPSSSSPHASSGLASTEVMPIPNKTIIENKSAVYAAVVRDLNDARGRILPFSVSFASFSIFNILSGISDYRCQLTC
jgi:nuclear pore complex protein Nup93